MDFITIMSTVRASTMIVEDHDLMAFGICEFLETIPIVQVVAKARNADEAQIEARSKKIDLVIMDIRLGAGLNGISLASEFMQEYPDLAILIYSSDSNAELVRRAIDAGVRGYVPKGAGIEKFKKAIEIIMAGGSYIDQSLSKPQREIEPLTPREKEVLKLIAEDKDNDEIAQLLEIKPVGVRAHRSNIMEKRNIKNAVELYRYAKKIFPNLNNPEPFS
ncbi:MAG: response regulator transcription factor [Betaproteobacteria bacterium]|nr:response regulator transcription factor [Betaproteobacteria bacterium]